MTSLILGSLNLNRLLKIFIFSFLLLPSVTIAQENFDLKNLKKIISKDLLDKEISKKKKAKQTKKRKQINRAKRTYDIPSREKLIGFFTQVWLVKNAPKLVWDFEKTNYGIAPAFEELLNKLGIFQQKFHILLLNSTSVLHFGLPLNDDEYIFVLSLPFIRIMDLSKVQISLLLLEDYFRIKSLKLESYIFSKELEAEAGKNFYKKKLNKAEFEQALKRYDEFVFEKGFNFQDQYEITKKMNTFLQSKPVLWNAYFNLLSKIDGLTKSNLLYKDLNKIYPSAEMQMKWLGHKSGQGAQ